MYQQGDFHIEKDHFHVKSDSYPISRINDVRVKRMTLKDNTIQIFFWLLVTSGAVWFANASIADIPLWFTVLCVLLTLLGMIIGVWFSARYILQIEFKHADGTGTQWIGVARCRNGKSLSTFEQQVLLVKQLLV